MRILIKCAVIALIIRLTSIASLHCIRHDREHTEYHECFSLQFITQFIQAVLQLEGHTSQYTIPEVVMNQKIKIYLVSWHFWYNLDVICSMPTGLPCHWSLSYHTKLLFLNSDNTVIETLKNLKKALLLHSNRMNIREKSILNRT